jgi:MerR family mercuric resistance operon transcriptional regulator
VGSFTIGKLAEAAGVNVETVRYYERRGLLEQPAREGPGYRQYSPTDVWRLQFIRRGKELGFTLGEIDAFIAAGSPDEILRAAKAKIEAVEARQRELAGLRGRLEQLVDLCERGDGVDCAALRVVS